MGGVRGSRYEAGGTRLRLRRVAFVFCGGRRLRRFASVFHYIIKNVKRQWLCIFLCCRFGSAFGMRAHKFFSFVGSVLGLVLGFWFGFGLGVVLGLGFGGAFGGSQKRICIFPFVFDSALWGRQAKYFCFFARRLHALKTDFGRKEKYFCFSCVLAAFGGCAKIFSKECKNT